MYSYMYMLRDEEIHNVKDGSQTSLY